MKASTTVIPHAGIQSERRGRETQPQHFQPTPAFVTLFGDELHPSAERHVRALLAGTKMQQAQIHLSQLDQSTALKNLVKHMATARQVLIFAHSENWTRKSHGVPDPGHRLALSAQRGEVMPTAALLRNLRDAEPQYVSAGAPKPMIHLVGCEAGALRSQITRHDPIWKSSYLLLYSSKKSTSLDTMASSLSAALKYADFCDHSERTVDPFTLFYIAGIHRAECMTLMGGELREPLVWHAPKSISALNDQTSLAMLSGSEKDLRQFRKRVKQLDAPLRALIPNASLREFLSSRIFHADQDAIETLIERHPELVNVPSVTGLRPLGEAIENGNLDLVKALLAANADPNLPDAEGDTALMAALKLDANEAIPLLLQHGAKSDLVVGSHSVLTQAVADNNLKALWLLLKDGMGYTRAGLEAPLQMAKRLENPEFKRALEYAYALASKAG